MVALETGNMTWWVVDVLRGAGIEPVVVDARQMKLISHSKKKSDKHDAVPWPMPFAAALPNAMQCMFPARSPGGAGRFCAPRHLIVKHSVANWNAARGMLRSVGVSVKKKDWNQEENWETVLDHPAVPVWMKALAGHPSPDVGAAGGRAQVSGRHGQGRAESVAPGSDCNGDARLWSACQPGSPESFG